MRVCMLGNTITQHAFTSIHSLKLTLWLLLTLEVRMHKQQWRVLFWRRTRYLIMISQTITRLIVIGEILEHREEKCQVYWQGIFILLLVFLSLHFGVSTSSYSYGVTNTTKTSPKDKRTSVYRRHLVEFIYDCSPKERRKGVKGHLKANVNGKAFWVPALCFTKRSQSQNCETDKCGCFRRVTQCSVKWGLCFGYW